MSTLQITHVGRPPLSKGQTALLALMNRRIREKQPLVFDDLVPVYYYNVKKTVNYPSLEFDRKGFKKFGNGEYDIQECYLTQNCVWNAKAKSLIRAWFVSAVGLLVIKGWLIAIPVVNIED